MKIFTLTTHVALLVFAFSLPLQPFSKYIYYPSNNQAICCIDIPL